MELCPRTCLRMHRCALWYLATHPGRAALWKGIVQNWSAIYREMEVGGGTLPTDLPEDASLCIVVFGYALNADGTPRGELLDRLEVALAAAEQYPNAYVLCTGGGTAEASDATEASVMASWLIDHGVALERILQEGRSYSTTANAQRSFALLKEYPQIQHVALVSSDYHIWLRQNSIPMPMCSAQAVARRRHRMPPKPP